MRSSPRWDKGFAFDAKVPGTEATLAPTWHDFLELLADCSTVDIPLPATERKPVADACKRA